MTASLLPGRLPRVAPAMERLYVYKTHTSRALVIFSLEEDRIGNYASGVFQQTQQEIEYGQDD